MIKDVSITTDMVDMDFCIVVDVDMVLDSHLTRQYFIDDVDVSIDIE